MGALHSLLRRLGPAPALIAALACALISCGPAPDEILAEARAFLDAGDDEAAQAAFRRGLERHPEDLELLLFACDFYLRGDRPDHFKPKLAIHYASRAQRAGDGGRADVAAAMVGALRAAGQHDEADAALSEARQRFGPVPELAGLERLPTNDR